MVVARLAGALLLGTLAAPPILAQPAAAPSPPPPTVVGPVVRASGQVEHLGDRFTVQFVVLNDGLAALQLTGEAGEAVVPITSPGSALAVLADRRFAFAWPALSDWAGPSMERLRDRVVGYSRSASQARFPIFAAAATHESIARPRVRALLQYATALDNAGQSQQAIEILRREMAAINLKSEWGGTEYSLVSSTLARLLFLNERVEEGLAALEQAATALSDTHYRLNPLVNRAAKLAEIGRYAEALTTIQAVQAGFDRDDDESVPGSERQFGWIKACALKGLGREQEAAVQFKAAFPVEEPVDPDWTLPSSQSIRERGLACMGDVEALVEEVLANLAARPIGDSLYVRLQPAFRPLPWTAPVWNKVRADRRVQAAMAELVRPLPPEMAPAVNQWRRPVSGRVD